MTVIISARSVENLCAGIFESAGVGAAEARCVASHLVRANLTGHDSHGIVRTPRYVQMLDEGLVFPGQTLSVLSDSGATIHLDGNGGFGQSIGEQSVDLGCGRARTTGAAVVALGNCGHLGRIGDWAEQAAAQGLASVHLVAVRGRSLVAPYGGMDRRLSTSPLCIGVPTDGRALIHDFATSTVAEGKVLVAAQGGKPVPKGALISSRGEFTDDPAELYGETVATAVPDAAVGPGAMTAFGGHKGSGLSILIEMLAGGLSGTGVNRTFLDTETAPFRNSMLSIYIDPDRFAGRAFLSQQAEAFGAYVRSARPARGHDGVLMPGDREIRLEAERTAAGLPLSGDLWDRLKDLASQFSVPVPDDVSLP